MAKQIVLKRGWFSINGNTKNLINYQEENHEKTKKVRAQACAKQGNHRKIDSE
jgi:hypothetical protein